MTGQHGSIAVECPNCSARFADWWRPCANAEFDPALADPGYLDCAAAATCPQCGTEIRLGALDSN